MRNEELNQLLDDDDDDLREELQRIEADIVRENFAQVNLGPGNTSSNVNKNQ